MARGTGRRGRGRGGRGGGRGRGGGGAAVVAAAVSSVTQVPNGEAEIEQSRVVGEVEVSSQSDLGVESEVAVGTAASTDFQPVVETVTTLGIDTTTTTTTDVETRKFGKDMITHDGGGDDDANGILVEAAAECSSSQEKNDSRSSGADLLRLNEATPAPPAPPGVLEEEATKTLLLSAEVEEKMECLNNNNNNNNGMEGKVLNLNSSTVVVFEDVFVLGNQERVDAAIIATEEEEEEEELVSDFHEVQQGMQQQQQQIATNCGEDGILQGVSMDLDLVVVGGTETFSVEEELVADVAAAVATEEVSNVPVTQMADDTSNSEVIIAVPNEAGNMEVVELEAEEEKKNHELEESSIPASSKIEGALEQPLEQPLGQRDKEFVGGVADLIGDAIGEDKDGEDKNGEANDGGKDIGGEGGEFDAEAQHSLPVSERRKHKRLEVFVGGLDKDTTEEDLKRLFQQVGDVVEVRLMRNSQTGKNKGYAFIRYATTAMAKRAAEELQHIEINGRPCGVLPSEENDTLFLGNISKSWKKEMVLDALRDMGINNIEELTLMEDPQLEGVNRGFSFIEFSTHKEALKAFRRLQQTDATFGTDRSAKVAWAQPLNEPDEETMSQVKSVFVDGMPPAWDEEKVREHFGKFGEIDRIVLARNMSAAKRKDFGFVNYVEREAAMACIDAISTSGIVDGEIKIKMKVMLAKPQVKSKPAKGGVRGGYPLGFKGDHRVGSVPAQPGRGGGGGRGGMHDAAGWGGTAHVDIIGKFGPAHDRATLSAVGVGRGMKGDRRNQGGGKGSFDDSEINMQADRDQPVAMVSEETSLLPLDEPEETLAAIEGDAGNGSTDQGGANQQITVQGEGVTKPTLDKFECVMCGFGSDVEGDYETHVKTRVHKMIEGLRRDQKLHNKTPLSLLHEYASRNHCEVTYETKSETNGPFQVVATIGGAAGGTSGPPAKGIGTGRNKARAKQMAAADVLEKIMEKVPESEFIKPGQSRQRFGERDHPGRKTRGGRGRFGGEGNSYRVRGRSSEGWHAVAEAYNTAYVGSYGMGLEKSRRHSGNDSIHFGGSGSVRGGYPNNPNSIPLYKNDFGGRGRGQVGYGDRHDERRGYNSFRAAHGRGSLPTQSETYAERYDRVQGGRGYVGGGYGGRRDYDYMVSGGGDIGGGGVGVGHSGRDHIPAALAYGGHDRPLHERYGGSVRDYEGPGIKRSYSAMEEEAKNFESQRGIPRARLEAPEPVPIQSVGVGQFGGATMYAEASRASVGRLPEQQQYTPYAVPQAVSVGHGVGQPQYLPLQHVSSQQLSTQHVSSQHVSTQQASMSGMMVGGQQHMPSPQASIPGSSIGGQVEGGTPYSIYDAAPQPTVGLQTGSFANTAAPQHQATHNFATGYAPTSYGYAAGYTPATAYTTSAGYTLSQEYMGVAAALPAQEVNAATSYPTQSAYTAQYAVTPQQIPSAIGGFTVPGAGQQTYY